MNRTTAPGASTRGVYRIRDGWGGQHSACVQYDDGTRLEMAEDLYRMRGHAPPFDDLPWKDKDKEPR